MSAVRSEDLQFMNRGSEGSASSGVRAVEKLEQDFMCPVVQLWRAGWRELGLTGTAKPRG